MGYGEVVGNESVHWTVVTEGDRGQETGSVRGRDPIKFDNIGAKRGLRRLASKRASARTADAKSLFFSKPSFGVRLMYGSKEEAQRARDSARIVERDGAVFLVLSVPAVRRKKERVAPPNPPAEIRVDW